MPVEGRSHSEVLEQSGICIDLQFSYRHCFGDDGLMRNFLELKHSNTERKLRASSSYVHFFCSVSQLVLMLIIQKVLLSPTDC